MRLGCLQLVCLSVTALNFTVFGQSPSHEPEIVTDRPDITESSIVIPKASIQAENGLTWTDDHAQRTFDASETLLRVGVASRTEVRFGAPNYLLGLTRRTPASGFADLSVGLKQQLGPLPGKFDLSVIAALSFPTGSNRASSHGFDPFVKFPWSKELRDGWSIGGMQSFFSYTENRRRNVTWEPTFYVERQITKPWDAFVEYGSDYAQHGGSKQVAHIGTAFKITPTNQVDFHFGFGISHATPGRFFAVGYSFRVDRLWGAFH